MDAASQRHIRIYRERNKRLFELVDKIKLWPSRAGVLHGIKEAKLDGEWLLVSTHCGCVFKTRDSKNGRVLRQLKHRNFRRPCKKCAVPDWKLEKFSK